jgi:hypothetical protein
LEIGLSVPEFLTNLVHTIAQSVYIGIDARFFARISAARWQAVNDNTLKVIQDMEGPNWQPGQ